MALSVTHTAVVSIPDDPNYAIGSDEWNATHAISGSIAASEVTSGAALTKTDDTNVTLTLGGTPTTALLKATSLTLGWTSTLSPVRGGTGVANNAASTLTISGSFGTTLTVTGTTTVTLPTSGTLAALGGTNTWTGVNTFSNATASSSSSTGAVVVNGGVGIQKGLYLLGAANAQSFNTMATLTDVSQGIGQQIATTHNVSTNIGVYNQLNSSILRASGSSAGMVSNGFVYQQYVGVQGSANVNTAYGFQVNFSTIDASPTGTITNLYDLAINSFQMQHSGSPSLSVTSHAGLFINDLGVNLVAGITVANQYGIYVKGQTNGGTTNYSIYVESGLSFFGGAAQTTGRRLAIRVVTAAGAVTATTADDAIVVNKTVGAATTVNLFASPATGSRLQIKDGKGDAGTNNITITPAAGNIDGAASLVMNINYQSATIVYNGTQWNVV